MNVGRFEPPATRLHTGEVLFVGGSSSPGAVERFTRCASAPPASSAPAVQAGHRWSAHLPARRFGARCARHRNE